MIELGLGSSVAIVRFVIDPPIKGIKRTMAWLTVFKRAPEILKELESLRAENAELKAAIKEFDPHYFENLAARKEFHEAWEALTKPKE